MKVLHLSFHNGCKNDIEYVCKELKLDLTFKEFNDGMSIGNDKYNITHEKAATAWKKYKNFYEEFDCIITSDTAPISRVFLQNNWKKKLIIWVCNRFDYAHQPDAEKIGFPDQEYYDLMNDVKNRENVHIIGYTPFENFYANKVRNLDIGNKVIKPIGKNMYEAYTSTIIENKAHTFIVGPYHNDNIMMNLRETVESLDIKVFNGRYNGPLDLAEFAGVIHIPYAWSNLALFEATQLGIIYFLPSLKFFKELSKKDNFWHQNMEYFNDYLHLSEWYCDEHKDIFVYFDSWEDLKNKTNNTDFKLQKNIINDFAIEFKKKNINKWISILKI
jgi:hypothetical protein